ncbi:MAG: hypothetical protein ACRC4O_08970 [Giesbergeria sp.]
MLASAWHETCPVKLAAFLPISQTTRCEGPDMTVSSLVSASTSRRLRAAAPGLHGGASSLLRVARGSDVRLPSGAALSDWAERAAGMLDLTPMMVGPLSQPVRVATAPAGQPQPTSRGAQA